MFELVESVEKRKKYSIELVLTRLMENRFIIDSKLEYFKILTKGYKTSPEGKIREHAVRNILEKAFSLLSQEDDTDLINLIKSDTLVQAAIDLSVRIHVFQKRRSGENTFISHIWQVSKKSFEYANTTEDINERDTFIISLLHDSIEDIDKNLHKEGTLPKNDSIQKEFITLIEYLFGPKLSKQINTITVSHIDIYLYNKTISINEIRLLEKKDRDELSTKVWMNQILTIDQEAILVKMVDMLENQDETQPSKIKERLEIIKSLNTRLEILNQTNNPTFNKLTGLLQSAYPVN